MILNIPIYIKIEKILFPPVINIDNGYGEYPPHPWIYILS